MWPVPQRRTGTLSYALFNWLLREIIVKTLFSIYSLGQTARHRWPQQIISPNVIARSSGPTCTKERVESVLNVSGLEFPKHTWNICRFYSCHSQVWISFLLACKPDDQSKVGICNKWMIKERIAGSQSAFCTLKVIVWKCSQGRSENVLADASLEKDPATSDSWPDPFFWLKICDMNWPEQDVLEAFPGHLCDLEHEDRLSGGRSSAPPASGSKVPTSFNSITLVEGGS